MCRCMCGERLVDAAGEDQARLMRAVRNSNPYDARYALEDEAERAAELAVKLAKTRAPTPWTGGVSRQVELFEGLPDVTAPPDRAVGGAETASRARAGAPKAPPAARGRAERSPGHDSGAIPAKCPVVGKPVCQYADCRHWTDRCAHPEVNRPRRRRARRRPPASFAP